MLTDVCDGRCQQKALVVFAKQHDDDLYDLAFCGHHGNQNYVTLTRNDWIVVEDERLFRIEDPKGKNSTSPAARRQVPSPRGEVHPASTDDDPGTGPVPVS